MKTQMKTQIFPLLRAGERILDMDFRQTLLLLVVSDHNDMKYKLLCFDLLRNSEIWRVDTLHDGEIQTSNQKEEILVANCKTRRYYSYDGVLIREIVLLDIQHPCRGRIFTTLSFSSLSFSRARWILKEFGKNGKSYSYCISQGKQDQDKRVYLASGNWYLPEGIEQKLPVYYIWRHFLFVYRLENKSRSLCFQKEIIFNHISDVLFLPTQKSLLIFDSVANEFFQMSSQQIFSSDWKKEKVKKDKRKTLDLCVHLEEYSKLRLWNNNFVCLLTTSEKNEQKISLYDCNTFK